MYSIWLQHFICELLEDLLLYISKEFTLFCFAPCPFIKLWSCWQNAARIKWNKIYKLICHIGESYIFLLLFFGINWSWLRESEKHQVLQQHVKFGLKYPHIKQTDCVFYRLLALLKSYSSAAENTLTSSPSVLRFASRPSSGTLSADRKRCVLKTLGPCRVCGRVTSEESICLSPSCPSETGADYHNGLWKLHMEQCFLWNKSGVCDSAAGSFY